MIPLLNLDLGRTILRLAVQSADTPHTVRYIVAYLSIYLSPGSGNLVVTADKVVDLECRLVPIYLHTE